MSTQREKGFTLIELLIVISLIGIITSSLVILINPQAQLQKVRDARRKSDFERIKQALEFYYNERGRYPPVGGPMHYTHIDGVLFNQPDGNPWDTYMQHLPNDPIGWCCGANDRHYNYVPDPDGQSFCLYANLENTSDPQLCNGGARCAGITPALPNWDWIHCGETLSRPCNYGTCSFGRNP